MIPARHISWGIAALVAALILLLTACESPTPTPAPTPPPSPTPTPEPTPEPTAVERLAWFDAPPDTAHWIAWSALRRMGIDDEPLSQQIASLDWVIDGITAEEAGALDDVSWLLRENPDIAHTALDLPWMATNGDITPDDRRALRAIRSAAEIDPDLGATLVGYPWVVSGPDRHELQALELVTELAAPGNRSLSATGIGAIRIAAIASDMVQSDEAPLLPIAAIIAKYPWVLDGIDPDEPDDLIQLSEALSRPATQGSSINRELAEVPWIRDGMTEIEKEAVVSWSDLFERAVENGSPWVKTVWEYSWAQDDVTEAEIRFIDNLKSLIESGGEQHTPAIETVLSNDWVQNDVTTTEANFIRELGRLAEVVPEWNSDALQSVVSQEWVTDGISPGEPGNLARIRPLFEAAGPEDVETLRILLRHDWVARGVDSSHSAALSVFAAMMEDSEPNNPEPALTIVGYPWLADLVTFEEQTVLVRLRRILRFEQVEERAHREILQESILAFEWLRGDVGKTESSSLYAIELMLRNYDSVSADFIVTILTKPWLKDGMESRERDLLMAYTGFVERGLDLNASFRSTISSYPWLDDNITAAESAFLITLLHLSRQYAADPTFHPTLVELAALPEFQDEIDQFDTTVINLLLSRQLLSQPEIVALDVFSDGPTDDDLYYLVALGAAKIRSEHQFRDLLENHHIASRTLSMPLAGEIELAVVRHTLFPDDDPTLDLMEDIATHLEEFMQVPFPLGNALILIMEASEQAGERPQFGVGYAARGYLVMVPPRHNPGFHLAVFHEMSHLYWGGHTGAPGWWTEGAAGFLPDIARDALGQETLEERHHQLLWDTRNECWHRGVSNISRYYHLQDTQPEVARDRGICIYALGEIFLMEMYMLLGRDATSAAMRQIYVDARDSGWLDPITDQQIYDAFRANTPDEKFDDFRRLFLRLHGGARVDLSESTS